MVELITAAVIAVILGAILIVIPWIILEIRRAPWASRPSSSSKLPEDPSTGERRAIRGVGGLLVLAGIAVIVLAVVSG